MACHVINTHTHTRTHVLECIFPIKIFSIIFIFIVIFRYFFGARHNLAPIFLRCLPANMPHTCFDGWAARTTIVEQLAYILKYEHTHTHTALHCGGDWGEENTYNYFIEFLFLLSWMYLYKKKLFIIFQQIENFYKLKATQNKITFCQLSFFKNVVFSCHIWGKMVQSISDLKRPNKSRTLKTVLTLTIYSVYSGSEEKLLKFLPFRLY